LQVGVDNLRFAFWNICNQVDPKLVIDLVLSENIDVIGLAESKLDTKQTLKSFRSAGANLYAPDTTLSSIMIFTKSGTDFQEFYSDSTRKFTLRTFQHRHEEWIFCVTHLPSKLHFNPRDQLIEAVQLSKQLREEERRRGHQRTILCGDLNMNPFEDGVTASAALHALATKQSVRLGNRTIRGLEHPFFYNPMWGLMGDTSVGPPGTMFYRTATHVSYDWNLFDQVLIRPHCMDAFVSVKIVDAFGDAKLSRKSGRPSRAIYSDHFPIVFEIKD